MTTEELTLALQPVIEAIQYQSTVTYGLLIGVGIVAGIGLIYLLLRRF